MLENLIYFSPYIILLCGICVLLCSFRSNNLVSRNFKIAKVATLGSMLLTLIFYNKSALPDYLDANLYTILFQVMLYLATLALLFVSRKWYASMNGDGYQFCISVLLAIIAGNLLIVSKNLLLTFIAVAIFMFANYLFFKHADKRKEIYLSSNIYALSTLFMLCPLVCATAYLYYGAGALDYTTLAVYVDLFSKNQFVLLAISGLILVFCFLLAVAPLHFWFTETMGQVILPVFSYFSLVLPIACWAGFIRFNVVVLSAVQPSFQLFYQALAVMALLIGTIGACSGKNVRKILAYSAVFHTGVILAVMQNFSLENVNAGFIYLIVYMIAMFGISTSLYALKVKGDYLFMLSDYEGASTQCPYTSAMFSMFLFSLIGFPPFAGFLGLFTAMNSLADGEHYCLMIFILSLFIVIAYAYLQIIKTLYFENSSENFDRADRGIYAVLFLTLTLTFGVMLKSQFLAQNVNVMLEDVFKWLI